MRPPSTHHRICCIPFQGIIHGPLSFLDPRIEHLRLGFTELIRSLTLVPLPVPPPPTSPPMPMSMPMSFSLILKLVPYSPPSKPSGKNTVDEIGFRRTTTYKLAPSAYRNDGHPKGAYAYEACDERW